MEGRRQVDRDHCIPAIRGEALDPRDVLDTRVVHQDVDRSAAGREACEHRLDLGWLREIGAFVAHLDAELRGESGAQALDLRGIAEAVEHQVRALARQRPGDAQSDAAGRTGDERELAFQHDPSLYNFL